MRKAPVPIASISNQKQMRVNQTKQPAKYLMKTVNKMDTMNANSTANPKSGQPYLRSEKYYWSVEMFMKSLKLNSYIIF